MTVTGQKIRIELADIQLQMPHPMRRINQTQHPQLFTRLRQPLKRHPHAWHTHNRVEDRNLDFPARLLHIRNLLLKRVHEPVIFKRICVLDLHALGRRGLGDVLNGQVASLVDSGEVEDVVALFEGKVAQHRVHAGCGVGDEDDGFGRCVEEGCDCGAGRVEVRWVLVPDEVVGARFGCVLEGAQGVADGEGVGAKGTCGELERVVSD